MGFRVKLHKTLADLGAGGSHGGGIGIFSQLQPPAVQGGTLLGVQGHIYLTPLWVPRAAHLQSIRCNTTVVGTANAVARLGLYRGQLRSQLGDLNLPGALVFDAGTVATDVGTGTKSISIDEVITEGVYWVAVVPQGAPVTQATFRAVNGQTPLMGSLDSGTIVSGLRESAALPAGALPDPISLNLFNFTPMPSGALGIAAWL